MALRAAGDFVEALDPDDRAAAVALTDTSAVDFTRNHRVVRQQIERLVGIGDYPVMLDMNIGLTEALTIADGNRTKLNDVILRECGMPMARLQDPARLEELNLVRDPCPDRVERENACAVAPPGVPTQ